MHECIRGSSYHKPHADWCPKSMKAGKTHAEVAYSGYGTYRLDCVENSVFNAHSCASSCT